MATKLISPKSHIDPLILLSKTSSNFPTAYNKDQNFLAWLLNATYAQNYQSIFYW